MKRHQTRRKKIRFRKTMKKYRGGTSHSAQEIVTKSGLDKLPDDDKNKLIASIDKVLKDKDIQIVDSGKVGPKFNQYFSSMTNTMNGAIEKLAEWLMPQSVKSNRKNTTKVSLYLYPSLTQSKPGEPNPNVKFGSIMLRVNNSYADVSSYFRSMFKQTDDTLANMRRGLKHNAKQKAFHTETFTINELLDKNWKLDKKPTETQADK